MKKEEVLSSLMLHWIHTHIQADAVSVLSILCTNRYFHPAQCERNQHRLASYIVRTVVSWIFRVVYFDVYRYNANIHQFHIWCFRTICITLPTTKQPHFRQSIHNSHSFCLISSNDSHYRNLISNIHAWECQLDSNAVWNFGLLRCQVLATKKDGKLRGQLQSTDYFTLSLSLVPSNFLALTLIQSEHKHRWRNPLFILLIWIITNDFNKTTV